MIHKNYYFDVNPEKLEGALDRFSQFFPITKIKSMTLGNWINWISPIPKQKNINVKEKLPEFHNTWYSANMTFVSLEEVH